MLLGSGRLPRPIQKTKQVKSTDIGRHTGGQVSEHDHGKDMIDIPRAARYLKLMPVVYDPGQGAPKTVIAGIMRYISPTWEAV